MVEAASSAVGASIEEVESSVARELADGRVSRSQGPGGLTPRVSVIVPTRGRPHDLERCVHAILESAFTDFELIVVDQSSDPPPLGVSDGRVVYVRSDSVGKSRALNEGFARAQAPFIICTDDDCTPGREWLSYALGAFQREPDLMLLYGELRAIPHNAEVELIPETIYRESVRLTRPHDLLGRYVAGANFAFRRELLDAVRGFDEAMGPGTSIPAWEEYDFAYRALLAGAPVKLDKGTYVTHWGARSVDTQAARRLLESYEFGEGAVLGKHLRRGDTAILRYLIRRMGRPVKWVLSGAVRGTRREGTRGVLVLSRGLLAGLRRRQGALRLFNM